MSRHGYSEDLEPWDLAQYRGRVANTIRGKQSQAFLRELRTALDAMPKKELIAKELVTEQGDCCALGCIGLARGIDMSNLDPDEAGHVAETFGIAETLVREITYENDEAPS